MTAETTLDALRRYDITDADLLSWENALGLEIPTDAQGHKVYSPHHINLFKNIRKHLALGRTLEQIRSIIKLPPASDAIQKSAPPIREQASVLVEKDPGLRQQEEQIRAQKILEQKIQEHRVQKQKADQAKQKEVKMPKNPEIAPINLALTKEDATSETKAPAPHIIKERPPKSPYASTPQPVRSHSGASEVVDLVKRLSQEKDHLYQKLLETEKLNSHLYSANNLYHRRVKDLEQSLDAIRKELPFEENVKLMDDKAKLHKQMIDTEKKLNEAELQLKQAQHAVLELNNNNLHLKQRFEEAKKPFDASVFCGDWMENGQLIEIAYDNFGINVESERVRLFRVSKAPERTFGSSAVITTNYQYETNPQWRRVETLVASYLPDQELEGEVTAEYILDGVPVAKAIYKVHCKRNS